MTFFRVELEGINIFMLDTRKVEYIGALHDPTSLIAKLGIASNVDLTMINGRIVWRDGEFPGLDEHKMVTEAQSHVQRVVYKHL